jgi:hypothetical protein
LQALMLGKKSADGSAVPPGGSSATPVRPSTGRASPPDTTPQRDAAATQSTPASVTVSARAAPLVTLTVLWCSRA